MKIVYHNDQIDAWSTATATMESGSDTSSAKSEEDCGIDLAASLDQNPTKAPAEALSDQLSLPYSMLWGLVLSQVSQKQVREAMFQPLAQLQPQGLLDDSAGGVEAVYRQSSTLSTIPVENMSYQLDKLYRLDELFEARSKSIRYCYSSDSEEDGEENSNWSSSCSSSETSEWDEDAERTHRNIRHRDTAAQKERERQLARQREWKRVANQRNQKDDFKTKQAQTTRTRRKVEGVASLQPRRSMPYRGGPSDLQSRKKPQPRMSPTLHHQILPKQDTKPNLQCQWPQQRMVVVEEASDEEASDEEDNQLFAEVPVADVSLTNFHDDDSITAYYDVGGEKEKEYPFQDLVGCCQWSPGDGLCSRQLEMEF